MTDAISVRQEAVQILLRVDQTDAYADILLNDVLKVRSFSNKDSALLSELIYGTLRWKGRLDFLLQQVYHGNWERIPEKIKIILELSLYQIVYLDRVPDFAVIHQAVDLAKKKMHPRWAGIVNAMLRRLAREHAAILFPDIKKSPVQSIATRYSHPEWLVAEWMKRFGIDRTEMICQTNNQKPILSLRVNRLKIDPLVLYQELLDQGYPVEYGEFVDVFFRLPQNQGIFKTDSFEQGFFTVQDESAGLVGKLMDPKPGEIILDMAAAPGGKTGHLVELSGDRAMIIAMDRHEGRLKRLRETLHRLQHHHVYTIQGDGRYLPVSSVNKILIDAPCSGIGVLRKRAELRWRANPDRIIELTVIQKQLLKNAVQCLKPDGVIVYSTCTVMKQENQEIVAWFLDQNPQFHIESAIQWVPKNVVSDEGWIETWPDLHQVDGSFAVRLKNGVK